MTAQQAGIFWAEGDGNPLDRRPNPPPCTFVHKHCKLKCEAERHCRDRIAVIRTVLALRMTGSPRNSEGIIGMRHFRAPQHCQTDGGLSKGKVAEGLATWQRDVRRQNGMKVTELSRFVTCHPKEEMSRTRETKHFVVNIV